MKILVLGGDGMLGHQLLAELQLRHEVKVTLRQSKPTYQQFGNRFNGENSYFNIDVLDLPALEKVINAFKPDAVINAVGIVKQRKIASDAIPSIQINALFPHQLSELCAQYDARMVTMSTDCVFSGDKGSYKPDDFPDANDLYGRTKYLGEVQEKHCVTIRSSIIGLELHNKKSLIEWFLAQTGKIQGYQRAFYTGLTTLAMTHLIETILLKYPMLHGVWQATSATINKYDLLVQLQQRLGRDDIIIEPNDTFFCDRSLDGSAFIAETGYQIPSWSQMLDELAQQIKRRDG